MEMTTAAPFLLGPKIEIYRDYRIFLADFYAYKKSQRKGYSFRQFAAAAGMKSPNYLQLVMKGERNLSEKMAYQVSKAMILKKQEEKYFISLVRQENSKSDEELAKAREEGLIALKKLVAKPIEVSKQIVFSNWQYMVVRELSFLSDFSPDPTYVVQKLEGLISEDEARRALRVLVETGFLVEKNGSLSAADPILDSGDQIFTHAQMLEYHRSNLKMWHDQLPKMDRNGLELGVLNLSVPLSKIPVIKQKIRDFQDQILGLIQSDTEAEAVVQLATYLFPLSTQKN